MGEPDKKKKRQGREKKVSLAHSHVFSFGSFTMFLVPRIFSPGKCMRKSIPAKGKGPFVFPKAFVENFGRMGKKPRGNGFPFPLP